MVVHSFAVDVRENLSVAAVVAAVATATSAETWKDCVHLIAVQRGVIAIPSREDLVRGEGADHRWRRLLLL